MKKPKVLDVYLILKMGILIYALLEILKTASIILYFAKWARASSGIGSFAIWLFANMDYFNMYPLNKINIYVSLQYHFLISIMVVFIVYYSINVIHLEREAKIIKINGIVMNTGYVAVLVLFIIMYNTPVLAYFDYNESNYWHFIKPATEAFLRSRLILRNFPIILSFFTSLALLIITYKKNKG